MKMMGDNLIPYIIGCQRSGLTANIAEHTNIKHETDYTLVQNTNQLMGYKKVTNMDKSNGVPSYATWGMGQANKLGNDTLAADAYDFKAKLKELCKELR